LQVKERRAQSGHGDQTIMIGGTAVFDRSEIDTNEMASFHFLEFNLGMLRFGFLEEWYFEELTEFVQFLIAWIIRGNQVDSGVNT